MRKPKYWGSATVGERGQMVIPADARKSLGIEAGDKLVIFGQEGGRRLTLVQAEVVTQFVAEALGDLTAFEQRLREDFPRTTEGESGEGTSE